jgi:MoaA/NifB/PqqE/SkfB family radical SAM enzyme
MPAGSRTDELCTEEVEALYRDAAAAGFKALVMWGGEPMLRPDAGRLLRVAHELGLDTTLITNGWWLQERADEVLPWSDRLLVSVDGPAAVHDEARRLPGLFDRLDRGLEYTQHRYPKVRVMILAVVSRFNVDHLEAIASYGAQRGTQVLFQAMNFTDYGFADRRLEANNVRLDEEHEAEAALEIARLRRFGYPVCDSNAYLRRLGSRVPRYRCHYKKVVFRVEPNGDFLDCTRVSAPMANVRTTSLGSFMAAPIFHDFIERCVACNRCRDAGVIEISHIWEGRLDAFRNAVNGLR